MDKNEFFNQLQSCWEDGTISTSDMKKQMEDFMDRETYLRMHQYKIWQGENGKFYTYLPDEENGRILKKRTTMKDIENLVIEFYKNHITVEELFHQWGEYKLATKSIKEQSYNRYETDYRRFIKDTEFGKTEVRKVTEDILEEFIISAILDNNLTMKAYSQLRTIIMGMFKFARKKKYSHISISNFFQDLDLSKNMFRRNQKNDAEEVFTDGEVEQITAYIKDNLSIWNLAVLLAFQTGLRVGELVALTPADIDWERSVLTVNKTEIRIKDKEKGSLTVTVAEHTKTDCGVREVLFPPAVEWTLREILRINPKGVYLFENEHGKRIRGTTISTKIYRICLAIGIEPRSIHKARKTYGTELFNAGVDECVIKDQMGHTDIITSLKYYRKSNRTAEERRSQITNAVIAI